MKINIQDMRYSEDTMYRIDDKASAIKIIQKYLSKICGDSILISENGIFDKQTIYELNKFQSEENIDVENYVGYNTFEKLYNRYMNEIEKEELAVMLQNPSSFTYKPGEYSDGIFEINKLLIDVLTYYGEFNVPNLNGYYSKETADAVLRIRQIFELRGDSTVDTSLYSRLLREWKSIQKIKNDVDYLME